MKILPRHWYVLYVKARHEKFVYEWLTKRNYNCYLPLVRTLKEWSDRKKYVDEPLFKSYLFVRLNPFQLELVKTTPGFLRFVQFGGEHATIPTEQLKNIEMIIKGNMPVEVNEEELKPGKPVKVVHGPIAGVTGELVQVRGKQRMAIRVEQINQSLLVEIPINYLKVLPEEEEQKKGV